MKRTLAAFLGVSALAFSQVSFAQAQEVGWYVGATFGQSKFKQFCSDTAGPGADCDDKDTAFRLLGGFQFNRYLALEIGYHQLGTAKASVPGASVENKASLFELLGVVSLPIGNQFSLYGKGGGYRGEMKGTFSSTAFGTTDEKATNSAMTWGAGVRYDLMRNLALRGEWQRYYTVGEHETVGQSDIEVLSLGVLWKF
jgi:OOP family OmpA-OmpF porin